MYPYYIHRFRPIIAMNASCMNMHEHHRMRPGGKKREKLAILFEEWTKCSERWESSSFVLRMREKTTEKQKGGRRWMTKADIIAKYRPGRTEEEATQIAEEIVMNKEATPDTQKPHPDAPLNPTMRLYLVWDESYESTEVDTVVESLFRQKEAGDGKKDTKAKGSKKRKSSSESSDESADSGTDDESSSSSKDKKNRRKGKKNKKTGQKGKKAKKNKQKKATKTKAKAKKKKSSDSSSDSEKSNESKIGSSSSDDEEQKKKAEKEAEKQRKLQEKEAEKNRKKAEAEAVKEQKRQEAEAKKAVTKEQNRKKSAVKKEGHANVACCTYHPLSVFHQISISIHHMDHLSIHNAHAHACKLQ